jgi:hypothetical protein
MADWANGYVGLRFIPQGESWRRRQIEVIERPSARRCLNINTLWFPHAGAPGDDDWKHGDNRNHRHSTLNDWCPPSSDDHSKRAGALRRWLRLWTYWWPRSLSALAGQVVVVDGDNAPLPALTRAFTKPPFGDRSVTSCVPSHQSGQVVVPEDIVLRGRPEEDWNPMTSPKPATSSTSGGTT